MKKILLSLIAITVMSGMAMADTERHRLVVIDTEGNQKVFDTSSLTKMTFDSISPVILQLDVAKTSGFNVEVNVVKPEDCNSYKLAIAPKKEIVSDWYKYIMNNGTDLFTESGTVLFGALNESSDYIVGALAYDKYNVANNISFIDVKTSVATDNEKPKVGYLLFDDGTWAQRAQSGKTPIGIIFSTTPSATDIAKGYTHGYALALRDAGEKLKWSVSNEPLQTGSYTSTTDFGFQTDMDGLSHTEYLLAQGAELYPAVNAAVSYSVPVPSTSSGWYLPSSGQWFEICTNLGGLSRDMPMIGKTEGYWNGLSDCTNSLALINEYMSLAGKDNYDPIKVSMGDYLWYWTSSESGPEQAYVIFFDNDQLVVEIAGYFKNYDFSSNRVRPVIAF